MNINDVITKTIIDKLKAGKIPWKKPYQGIERPAMNFKSKKAYRGINAFLLNDVGFRSPYWLTYKQLTELGGTNKGAKGHKIIFAKQTKYDDADGNEKKGLIYKYSHVFNLDDIEGVDCPFKDETGIVHQEFEYINNCDLVLNEMKENNKIPEIKYHLKAAAYYIPSTDEIFTCRSNEYVSSEAFYSTVFHEIIHSTGHKSRLDRDLNGSKRTDSYAKEELIAEMGACFLCGITGIATQTIENSAAYIQSWLQRFSEDSTLVIQAASKAQKAVDYLDVNILETQKIEL